MCYVLRVIAFLFNDIYNMGTILTKKGENLMASVTFDHVYKRFGDVVAVNDLDIKV